MDCARPDDTTRQESRVVRRPLLEAATMRDGSFSPEPWSPREESSRTADGNMVLSSTAIRLICGLAAPLAFGCPGLCFYFLIQPFGTNPPPKEVALIVGIVFAGFGLMLVGIALFYRGSVTTTIPRVA